jgi:hypothetical protein
MGGFEAMAKNQHRGAPKAPRAPLPQSKPVVVIKPRRRPAPTPTPTQPLPPAAATAGNYNP